MTALYNEIDPKAAAWLRELIKRGLIAPGDVIEASIEDLTPNDLRGYTQVHFFAGIGVWSYALRRAGWPDDRPVWTGSCPCQPFSAAGKGGGFADERHLWPHFHWLISQCRPDHVIGEQVASKDGLAWIDLVQADLEGEGYASGAVDLCAAGVGAPHIRQRLWWFGEKLEHASSDGRQQWRSEPRGRGATGRRGPDGLDDDDDDTRLEGQRNGYQTAIGRVGATGPTAETGEPGGVEHAQHAERRPVNIYPQDGRVGADVGRKETHGLFGARSEVRELANASSIGRIGRGSSEAGDQPGAIERPDGLRDAIGLAGPADADGARDSGEHRVRNMAARPGPVNGLWADADWLYCRDGRWRSVEPGAFPLANGYAERVGLLRGAGNAIVAPATQAFIEAYLDAKEAEHLRLTDVSALTTDKGIFA